jgi:hypothetical protein
MANIAWDGTGGNDAEVDANWHGGTKPGVGDVAVFDATANGPCQLTAGVSWQGINAAGAFDQAFDQNGQTITCSGAISWDSAGTAITLDAAQTITGDANFSLLAGPTYTITSLDVDMQGTGSFVIGQNTTFHKLTVSGNGKTVTKAGNFQCRPVQLTIGDGATYNTGTQSFTAVDMTGGNDLSIHANAAIAGSSDIWFVCFTGTTTYNIPAISALGHTGAMYFESKATTVTIELGGNISNGGKLSFLHMGAFTGGTVNFNNHSYLCGGFGWGSYTSGRRITLNLEDCTMDVNGAANVDVNTGPTTLNLGSSTWTISSNVTMGSRTTVSAGTSQWTLDGSTGCTFRAEGETFGDIILNKTAGRWHFSMALVAADIILTDGAFDMNGLTLSCTNFENSTADATTFDANLTVTGDGDYNTSDTFTRLILTAGTTHTVTAGTTLTLSNYTAGDFDGISFLSDTSGTAFNFANPANMVVSNMTVTDCNATNMVDANDGTNTTGGGNTNWDFMDLASITPSSCDIRGGVAFTVLDNGTGFVGTCTVVIGGRNATNITIAAANILTGTSPVGAIGTTTAIITNGDGETGTLAWTYTSIPPRKTGVNISTGIGL